MAGIVFLGPLGPREGCCTCPPAEHPEAARENIWVASATGELDAVRSFLDREPGLADRRGGTRHWEPLLYLSFSRLLRTDPGRATAMVEIARGGEGSSLVLIPSEGRR